MYFSIYSMREASGLVRTKKLFGGLLNDIRRKKPHYISDILHGFHPQCLSSFLFLYFACLAPIVAFGALLGEATENRIATIESLVSGIFCWKSHRQHPEGKFHTFIALLSRSKWPNANRQSKSDCSIRSFYQKISLKKHSQTLFMTSLVWDVKDFYDPFIGLV